MSFKENLLKKIDIDHTAEKIIASIGSPDSSLKIDKEAARHLLGMSLYQYQKERDLDLYVQKSEEGRDRVLVLDNDLAIYQTTPEDVGLRKSPTLKEMLSFRNARKILNDSDVKISKKEASVKLLKEECIALLDLSYNRKDIEAIERDGITSLERDYPDGVVEALVLLSDLLGYKPVPKAFRLRHSEGYGKAEKIRKGSYTLGPVVIYNKMDNTLKMLENDISGTNAQIMDFLSAVFSGEEKAAVEGADVFHRLAGLVEIKPVQD